MVVITKTGLPEENETSFISNFITGSKLAGISQFSGGFVLIWETNRTQEVFGRRQ